MDWRRKVIHIDEQNIDLKKDIFGYRIVHPVKDKEGNWNISNLLFGGWRNLFIIIIILLFLLAISYSYYHDTTECRKIVERDSAIIQEENQQLPRISYSSGGENKNQT